MALATKMPIRSSLLWASFLLLQHWRAILSAPVPSKAGNCRNFSSTIFLEHGGSSSSHRGLGTSPSLQQSLSQAETEFLQEAFTESYQSLHAKSTTAPEEENDCRQALYSVNLVPPLVKRQTNHHRHSSVAADCQPLPPWYNYDQMLQWQVEATCGGSNCRTQSLFTARDIEGQNADLPTAQDFLGAFTSYLGSSSKATFNGRRVRQLQQLSNLVEVTEYSCSKDIQEFSAQVVMEVDLVPSYDEASYLSRMQDLQLWSEAIEATYNSLAFYTCDAPNFRTVTGVQVNNISAPGIPSKLLLEISLQVECRDCAGVASIFREDTQTEALPSNWQPLTLQDLEGPNMRQANDPNQVSSCFCSASDGQRTSDGAPTEGQFRSALYATVQQLQAEQRLSHVEMVRCIIQVQDKECPFEEHAQLETQLMLQLTTPLNETNVDYQEMAQAIQASYNQLSFQLCDQPLFRRLINVTLSDVPDDYRLVFSIQAEARGTVYNDTQWLFSDVNTTSVESVDVLGLPETPVSLCACPTTSLDLYRAPTYDELVVVINDHLNNTFSVADLQGNSTFVLQVKTLQQVDGYECRPPQDSPHGHNNVLVNFSGQPAMLTSEESHLLEQTFQQSYNDMTFDQCDGKFRSIDSVKLLVLPKQTERRRRGRNLQLDSNAGNDDVYWDVNATFPNATDGNATLAPGNSSASNVTQENSVPSLEATTVFRVGAECRRCPPDDTSTFGLFDSFRRGRDLQYMGFGGSDEFAWGLKTFSQPTQPPSPYVPDTCYCPIGTDPVNGLAPTLSAFMAVFQARVNQLVKSGRVKSIQSVNVVEVSDNMCFNSLTESQQFYAMDFVRLDVSQYPDQEVKTAFRYAANSLRYSDCAPLVKDLKDMQFVPVDMVMSKQGSLATTAPKAVRMNMDVSVLESTVTFKEYMGARKSEVEDIMAGILHKPSSEKKTSGSTIAPTNPEIQAMAAFVSNEPAPTPQPTNAAETTPTPTDTSTESPRPPPTQPVTHSTTQPVTRPPTQPVTPMPLPTDPSPTPTGPPTESPTPLPTQPLMPPPTEPPMSLPTDPPTPPSTPQPTDPPVSKLTRTSSTGKPTLPPVVAVSPTRPAFNTFPTFPTLTAKPTIAPPPTAPPTVLPTDSPTEVPTDPPTEAPTDQPTEAPTDPPTEAPTDPPTQAPTGPPTGAPTNQPTAAPTVPPTKAPTYAPTTSAPTPAATTLTPTLAPTNQPTAVPTVPPTKAPTPAPTIAVAARGSTGTTTGRAPTIP